MRKVLLTIIIYLISAMFLAGCSGKVAPPPGDVPEPGQEATEEIVTPVETPAPEVSEPKEEEETTSEPVDNYYVHRFDSYDDLLYAYKEAQDRYYTRDQIELIFGWGEMLPDYGWPDNTSSYDVGYVYYDVDSDGSDELILTLGKDIVEIYSYFTGKVQRFYSAPYGDEVTLYPGGILKQYAPETSEFPGTSWYSYDAGLAGYYKDFEELNGEYYTFCHHDFSGPEYDEIAARLREDPDADMPVWIREYEDYLTESDYKKLLPKTKPIKLPESKKLADVVLPDGYEPRYNKGEKDDEEAFADKSLAQRMAGKYSYKYSDEELYIMDVVPFGDNIYAFCGQAMADDSGSIEAYTFWVSEFVPYDADEVTGADLLLRFRGMMHLIGSQKAKISDRCRNSRFMSQQWMKWSLLPIHLECLEGNRARIFDIIHFG